MAEITSQTVAKELHVPLGHPVHVHASAHEYESAHVWYARRETVKKRMVN